MTKLLIPGTLAGVALLAIAGVAQSCTPRPAAVQGVVLVSIDTLRADRLPSYGYGRDTAPFITRLAESGVLFEQVVAQSPWTGPSHASLLASRYPSELGMGTWREPRPLPAQAKSLAEVMHAQGFATAAVVGGGYLSAKMGFAEGFESFEETAPSMGADVSVDRALAWLGERAVTERFFLFLHTFQVHNYAPSETAGRRFVRVYDGPLSRVHSLPTVLEFPDSWRRKLGRLEGAHLRYVTDRYDAALYSVDRELERLHRYLEQSGLAERTVFVIVSDHGEEFADHGSSGHGWTLYEENVRVPWILQHPTLQPRRIEEPVRLLDLAPTLSGLANIEPADDWRGVDLAPMLRGQPVSLPPAFTEYAHQPLHALRQGELKYVEKLDGSQPQLFDLDSDPDEVRNLAGAGHPAEDALRRELRAWARRNASAALPARPSTLDPKLRDALEALGYVEPGSAFE